MEWVEYSTCIHTCVAVYCRQANVNIEHVCAQMHNNIIIIFCDCVHVYIYIHVHATSFFLSISEKCSYIRDCSCKYNSDGAEVFNA